MKVILTILKDELDGEHSVFSVYDNPTDLKNNLSQDLGLFLSGGLPSDDYFFQVVECSIRKTTVQKLKDELLDEEEISELIDLVVDDNKTTILLSLDSYEITEDIIQKYIEDHPNESEPDFDDISQRLDDDKNFFDEYVDKVSQIYKNTL